MEELEKKSNYCVSLRPSLVEAAREKGMKSLSSWIDDELEVYLGDEILFQCSFCECVMSRRTWREQKRVCLACSQVNDWDNLKNIEVRE